jgi:hypothetical protein
MNLNFAHLFAAFLSLAMCTVHAQPVSKTLIEAPLQRVNSEKPTNIRGALDRAPKSSGKVLLLYRGYPGIAKIEGSEGRVKFMSGQEHFEEMIPAMLKAGISTVTLDCPSDQQSACRDSYRSSTQHADDVRALLKVLRQMGFTEFHLMGHSYGGVSSHWLSLHLGEDFKSVIHSATQSGSPPLFNADLAKSMKDFPHDAVKTEVLYLHHLNDQCYLTPYSYAKANAKPNRLVTVMGGDRSGPTCGAGSFHSYLGRRAEVADALVRWVRDGEVVTVVKGPLD